MFCVLVSSLEATRPQEEGNFPESRYIVKYSAYMSHNLECLSKIDFNPSVNRVYVLIHDFMSIGSDREQTPSLCSIKLSFSAYDRPRSYKIVHTRIGAR